MTFQSRWSGRVSAVALLIGVFQSPTRAADTVQAQSVIINEELTKMWASVDIKPSKKATDFEFVRRAFIDLVGRIPTVEEVRDFAEGDTSPNKRTKLIHRLLYEKEYKPKFSERVNPKDPKSVITYDYANEYSRHFANIWGVWLMTRGGVAELYHESHGTLA
jgi:hypothetical protein